MDNRYSILTKDMTRCYVCGVKCKAHVHEVFFGSSNRKKSIEYGCCIPLCPAHHNMSNAGVHFNHDLDLKLKKKMQIAWMEEYCDENDDKIKEFIKVFGRNYLDEEDLTPICKENIYY